MARGKALFVVVAFIDCVNPIHSQSHVASELFYLNSSDPPATWQGDQPNQPTSHTMVQEIIIFIKGNLFFNRYFSYSSLSVSVHRFFVWITLRWCWLRVESLPESLRYVRFARWKFGDSWPAQRISIGRHSLLLHDTSWTPCSTQIFPSRPTKKIIRGRKEMFIQYLRISSFARYFLLISTLNKLAHSRHTQKTTSSL